VLDILDQHVDLLAQLALGRLGRLELGLEVGQGVVEAVNLDGELLLEGVRLLHAEAVLVLVLLLPVSVVTPPLLNSSLELDLEGSELLYFHVEGLDGPLQAGDLCLGRCACSGLGIRGTTQFIQLGGKLVLVHAGVFDGQLHLVELLVGLLGLHLEPLLGAGDLHEVLVESLDLDVILVHGDLQLLHNLLDGDLLALEDLDLGVELGDLGLHHALLLHHLLLFSGHSLNLLLQLHHRSLVLSSQCMNLLF